MSDSTGDHLGGPVLKEDASWKNVKGIWINWSTGSLWLLFRRPSF